MIDKRTILYLLLISMFLLSMMTLMISADTTEKTSAKAFALYNPDTNTFLAGKNLDLRLPMASTTKILTALISIEELDFDEVITVPEEAVGIEGSSVYLTAGDQLTVRDLVYSVLLQSANDASNVLALRIGNTIEGFSQIMNARASLIGAENSNFENPHGLDSAEHYTTAKDLALISAEAMKNPTFRKIVSTYKYSFSIGDKSRVLINHNKLLKQYDSCIGIKTGYTKKCGRCLVSAAKKDDITLIAVTLSDPNDWKDHQNLLNLGFDMLESTDLCSLISIPDSLPVISGNKNELAIGINETDRTVIMLKNAEQIKYDLKLPQYITKEIRQGDVIGQITLYLDKETKTIDVIALESVKIKKHKLSLFS